MYDQEKKDYLLKGAREIRYEAVHVDFLSKRDIEILTKTGLPDCLSPYTLIAPGEQYGGYSLFDRITVFEKYPIDNEDFKNFCFFARNDYGYLVITREGEVCLLEDETEELIYVNESLDAYLESAYEYLCFIDQLAEDYGEDAYIEGDYTEDDVFFLRDLLAKIDEAAVEDGFWADELIKLIDDIEC